MDYGIIATLVEAATGGDELSILDFANLGVLGALVLAFMKGLVVPKYVLDRTIKELDEEKAELTELRTRLDKEVLPQLWKTTELLAKFANGNRGNDKGQDGR